MTQRPKNIAVALFPGFQALDVFGPIDALNILSTSHTLNLSILASTLDPVSTKHKQGPNPSVQSNFSESIVPTHTFETAPKDIEVLLVPGGFGTRDDENIKPVIEYIQRVYPSLKYLISVCTGSAILAKTGLLDNRRATSNKKSFAWVKQQNPSVKWISKARWVVDGNIWTSSGVSAGMDLIFSWIAEVWGEETSVSIADSSEYERNVDSGKDRFAERWGVDGL